MSPHHSDQISGKSEVNWIVFCVTISKVLSESVSEWQGHLLSCSGQLKSNSKKILIYSGTFPPQYLYEPPR